MRLGLEDGSIPDANINASSNFVAQGGYTGISTPADGRLNKIPQDDITIGAWEPSALDTNQWIQVDLGKPTYVYGVLMQGRQDHTNQWVTKYKVQYEPPSQASLVDVQNQLGETQVRNTNPILSTSGVAGIFNASNEFVVVEGTDPLPPPPYPSFPCYWS